MRGPVDVRATFVFPRPKSHYLPANGKRRDPVLRDDAPLWHVSPPDVDKLARSCLDALTGVLWTDDAQVADIHARKVYCGDGTTVGAVVEVRSL